jgi:hypothetical protein
VGSPFSVCCWLALLTLMSVGCKSGSDAGRGEVRRYFGPYTVYGPAAATGTGQPLPAKALGQEFMDLGPVATGVVLLPRIQTESSKSSHEGEPQPTLLSASLFQRVAHADTTATGRIRTCLQRIFPFADSTRPAYNEGDEEQECQDPFLFGVLRTSSRRRLRGVCSGFAWLSHSGRKP